MRPFLRFLIFFLFLLLSSSPAFSQEASVWLAPNLKSSIGMKGGELVSGLKGVSVFKYYCDTIIRANNDVLRDQFRYLRENNVKIALECAPLSAPGYHLESFGEPLKILNVVDRVNHLGGEVSYVALDEPVYYAHYKETGKRFVGWSIDRICANASENIRPVFDKYPNISFGLIEPVNKVKEQDVLEFVNCFRQYVGRSLDFFHADVVWNRPDALSAALNWREIMGRNGIRYGVIFNSSIRSAGNNDWINSAESNIRKYSKVGGLGDAVIQSWNVEPQKIYPKKGERSITELAVKACDSFKCKK